MAIPSPQKVMVGIMRNLRGARHLDTQKTVGKPEGGYQSPPLEDLPGTAANFRKAQAEGLNNPANRETLINPPSPGENKG